MKFSFAYGYLKKEWVCAKGERVVSAIISPYHVKCYQEFWLNSFRFLKENCPIFKTYLDIEIEVKYAPVGQISTEI